MFLNFSFPINHRRTAAFALECTPVRSCIDASGVRGGETAESVRCQELQSAECGVQPKSAGSTVAAATTSSTATASFSATANPSPTATAAAAVQSATSAVTSPESYSTAGAAATTNAV